MCLGAGAGFLVLPSRELKAVVTGSEGVQLQSTLLPIIAFVCLSAIFFVWAWRLITRQGRRSDGGLLPPASLRSGAVLFALGGLVQMFMGVVGILNGLFAVAAAA